MVGQWSLEWVGESRRCPNKCSSSLFMGTQPHWHICKRYRQRYVAQVVGRSQLESVGESWWNFDKRSNCCMLGTQSHWHICERNRYGYASQVVGRSQLVRLGVSWWRFDQCSVSLFVGTQQTWHLRKRKWRTDVLKVVWRPMARLGCPRWRLAQCSGCCWCCRSQSHPHSRLRNWWCTIQKELDWSLDWLGQVRRWDRSLHSSNLRSVIFMKSGLCN